jgi:hypothetical protein
VTYSMVTGRPGREQFGIENKGPGGGGSLQSSPFLYDRPDLARYFPPGGRFSIMRYCLFFLHETHSSWPPKAKRLPVCRSR